MNTLPKFLVLICYILFIRTLYRFTCMFLIDFRKKINFGYYRDS